MNEMREGIKATHAQKGKDLLIKISDGGAGFVTVAGMRSRRLTLNGAAVDLTDAEALDRYRDHFAKVGLRGAEITGSGVFKDDASDSRIRQAFFDGAVLSYQFILPEFARIEGPFQITSLEYRGDHAGESTFEMAFEHAGPLAFSPINKL